MMSLSVPHSHPVPTFGDSFTITCYVCGIPSSKEWAQKVQSRPTAPHKPYFPFLLQISPIGGAILCENGSTYLCAFCHASLEAQWNIYESQQLIPPADRKYNIQKFICAVCGVETYRKRIRALPFQEFSFLERQRQAGSITLGNNPLAVVCLDCSETLWAQSAEYDRWGLPVHKRHFNWMARPPPPEESMEATVARLPSGEIQLPRCPPTEPSIVPFKIVVKSSTLSAGKISDSSSSKMSRGGNWKADSQKLQENPHHNFSSPGPPQTSSSKTLLTSTTPPSMGLVGGCHNQQPPVVTVAPMSNHTTLINLRKDSLQLPNHPQQVGPVGMLPVQSTTAVYPPTASHALHVWGNNIRVPGTLRPQIEAYPAYGSLTQAQAVAAAGRPWLPHPASTDSPRHHSYVSSLQNKSRMVECSVSSTSPVHTSPARSFSSPSAPYGANSSAETCSTIVSVVSPVPLREHKRIILEEQRQVATINSEKRSTIPGGGNAGGYEISELVYQKKDLWIQPSPSPSQGLEGGGRCGSGKKFAQILPVSSTNEDIEKAGISTSSGGSKDASKLYPSNSEKVQETVSETGLREIGAGAGGSRSKSIARFTIKRSPSRSPESATGGGAAGGGEENERVYRWEFHIPKKRNWHVFMKENQPTSSTPTLQSEGTKEKSESPPPQAVQHPEKKKSSSSECSGEGPAKSYGETTSLSKEKDDAAIKYPSQRSSRRATSTSSGDSAMDLSVTTEPKASERTNLKGVRGGASNFRMEYLCQSTTTTRATEEVC